MRGHVGEKSLFKQRRRYEMLNDKIVDKLIYEKDGTK